MNLRENEKIKEPELKEYGLDERIVRDLPVEGANGKYISIIPRKWNPNGAYIEEIITIVIAIGVYVYLFKFQFGWSWLGIIALGGFLLVPGMFLLLLIGLLVEFIKKLLSGNYKNYLKYQRDLGIYKENERIYNRELFRGTLSKYPLTITIPYDKDIKIKADESIKVLSEYGSILEDLSEKYPGEIFKEELLPKSKNEMKTYFYNMALISKLNNWNDYLTILQSGYMCLSSFQRIDTDIIEHPGKKYFENLEKLKDLQNEGLSISVEEESSFVKNTINIKEYENYSQLLHKRSEETQELLDEFANFIKTVDDFLKIDWLYLYSMKSESRTLRLT